MIPNDTSIEAERVQLELLRKMTRQQRFVLAAGLSQQLRDASRATIRRLNPEFSNSEIELAFIELHYGKALADSVRSSNRLV